MLALLFALVPVQQSPQAQRTGPLPVERPNVAVIVIDDVGVDMIGAYGEAPVSAPCTPEIDALAAEGLLFRNAYTNPWCSPSRAQILTGRHGFRTGVGQVVGQGGHQSGLPVAEDTLPELLVGYDSAAIGKWHLAHPEERNGDGQGVGHALRSGFDVFRGTTHNLGVGPVPAPTGCVQECVDGPWDYFRWVKTEDCNQFCETTYATIDVEQDALEAAASFREPWLLYVSYHAAHLPTHVPPAELCPGAAGCTCTTIDGDETDIELAKAMVEALDTSVGSLVAGLRALDPEVYVFLIGDNGTYGGVSEGTPGGCFDPNRAKGTVYEAGVNVPFVAVGPGVPSAEIDALVSSVDLFATVLELGAAPSSQGPQGPIDAVSLVPYLLGATGPLRSTVYAESFEPNGLPFAPTRHERMVRNERYKLVVCTDDTGTVVEEFFDLALDPCEAIDLCAGTACASLPAGAQEAYDALQAELARLGVAGGTAASR